MKTIFRFLSTGVMTAAFLAVAATAGFGQDTPAATPNANCADIDGHNALYTKFTGMYNKKTASEIRAALATGKEYLEKFGSCEAFKDQVDFVKPHVVRLEKDVVVADEREKLAPFFAQFDKGLAAGNPDDVLAAGKQILSVRKDDMNIAFAMALIAAEKSTPANQFKYSDDAITYSKLVSSKLKGGWQFDRKYNEGPKKGSPYIGIGTYNRDDRDLATSELNYAVAFQTFYGKNDAKTALPLYYEIAQGKYKDDPRVYQAIGSHFAKEVIRINGDIAKLLAAQKLLKTDEEKLAMEPQIKDAIGMAYGNAERAMDYYSRAYKMAKSDTPAAKTYKDGLYKDLGILYEGRFSKKDGLDDYIAAVMTKQMPNPTTPVTPVSDPEPTPTTTTGTATKPAAPAAAPTTTTTTATKPPTKPMSKTVTTKSTTATTKPAMSKKVPRR